MNISARTKKLIEQIAAPKITLKLAVPTYSAADSVPAEEARAKFDQVFDNFLQVTTEWNEPAEQDEEDDDEQEDDPFLDFAEAHDDKPRPVHAVCITTGGGKTQRAAAKIARFIREGKLKPGWSVLYLVPRHELGEHIDDLFRDLGVTAQVYRGRRADNPNIPGNEDLPKDQRTKMCIDLESLGRAEKCGKDITKACCRYKPKGGEERRCQFYDNGCGYQAQFPDEQPQVWVAAHEMMHYAQKRFGKIAFMVIDESFWKRGVYGVETRGDETRGISLDDMGIDMPSPGHRKDLIEMLFAHPLGALHRVGVSDWFTPGHCKFMIGVEWERVNSLKITPEMSPAQIKNIEKEMPKIRTARRMVGVWGALRALLNDKDIDVSGRLILDENDAGQRILKVRGVKPVRKSRQVPTFIMDATLPDIEILRAWFPQVEIVADIDVVMPEHVHVTQILGAPVSKRRLFRWRKKEPKDGQRNLKAIRRLVVQWWMEHGRKPMLVICQEAVEEWLKKAGLPEGIKVEHYNNISGLDRYKDVGSLLLIGRTIPRPVAIEAYAGALTGEEPIKVPADQWWYPPVERAIRMADGTGILVERCDQHPDPVGEHVRFQICEGEMLQALGRARAINRTAESPLAIGIVADVVLPITVNKVEIWQAPSQAMEPAEEGAMLFSPKDMVEVWPQIWKTVDAAKKTLGKIRASAQRAGTRCQNGIYDSYIPFRHSVAVLYQRPGPKQKLQRAVFDLDKWPSPRAWFDEKRKAIIALLQSWEPGDISPLAGTSKLAIVDSLVRILREARYTLSADVKQHKEYVGTGRPGRYTLSKDAMTAYDGAPDGALTPHVNAYSALPLELRMRAGSARGGK
jgi:putative DNA primase/helicase